MTELATYLCIIAAIWAAVGLIAIAVSIWKESKKSRSDTYLSACRKIYLKHNAKD